MTSSSRNIVILGSGTDIWVYGMIFMEGGWFPNKTVCWKRNTNWVCIPYCSILSSAINRLYTECGACAFHYSEINFGRSEILDTMWLPKVISPRRFVFYMDNLISTWRAMAELLIDLLDEFLSRSWEIFWLDVNRKKLNVSWLGREVGSAGQ